MKVVVGFIHRSDAIAPQFRRSLTMALMRDAARLRRIVGELDEESSANISSARCRIVQRFLDHPAKPDWLWMLDTDMTFPEDMLDRLLNGASVERPIIGGLCFGVRPMKVDGEERLNETMGTPLELFPTVYTLGEDGRMRHWATYPRETLFAVHSTGGACLLVHRSVLADPRWTADGHPQPWFRESVLAGEVCSEDHFFCLRAGSFGYPIHINSAARTGHVKTFVADEEMYLAQQIGRRTARAAA